MTEKRFTVYGKEIVQDNECWAVAYSEYNADVIATALNELNDENQELQGKYDAQKQLFCQLNSDKNNIWQDYQDLKKENEQLKSELKGLRKKYNDFSETVDKRLKELYK